MSKHRIDASQINPDVLKRALAKAGITDVSALYKKPSGKKSKKRAGGGSPPHDLLCNALNSAGIRHEREFKNAVPGRRFRIDIAIEASKLAIEVDGWQHHGKTLTGFQKDRERQNLLTKHNWRILRFTAGDIYRDVHGCVEQIRSAVQQAVQ